MLRVLDKETLSEKFRNLTLDVVGFDHDEAMRFRRYIREPYGMVLVTGPTGSGKTTTLYAAINEIKNDEDKIITIEDPVEYQVRGITQIPVNEKKGLTFARGLRSILRHDPDKIMVGEIRDQETAQIAINSALTGHLVFTTVHANNVHGRDRPFHQHGRRALQFRLRAQLHHGPAPGSRDLRELQAPSQLYRRKFSRNRASIPPNGARFTFYEGAGCLECSGSGYRGRTAITELLDLSDRIREMIIERRPTSEIKRMAKQEGMSFLRESGLKKIRAGITTLREINKVTFLE